MARRRGGRWRRRSASASAAAPGAGAGVLAAERGSAAPEAGAGAAATSSRRRKRRRPRRQRDRGDGGAAGAASGQTEAPVSANSLADAISTQAGSALQTSCHLEGVAAHLGNSVLQTTAEKIMNSNKTEQRIIQAGNKALKVSAADGAACSSLAHREPSVGETEASRSKLFARSDVRFLKDNCTAVGIDDSDTSMVCHNIDPNLPEMKSSNLLGNLEEVYQNRICPGFSSLQKSEEYKGNENGVSLSSSGSKEEKKRRKKRGGKRHNRCKKTTSQDPTLPTALGNSGLITMVSGNNTFGLKPKGQRNEHDQNRAHMASLVPVDNERPEAYGVNLDGTIELGMSNLDCTNMERNGLQLQYLPWNMYHGANYVSPAHFAEAYLAGTMNNRFELGTRNFDRAFEGRYELGESSLDSTNMKRNGLQEQEVPYKSNNHNANYLSPYHSSESYMENLKLDFWLGRPLRFSRKKLLILDLNGLLVDINEDKHNAHMADAKVRGKLVFRRPYCDDFLNFCALNFELGVWSSRKKENVASVVDIVMRDFKHYLLFCWDMSKCTFTGHKTLENMHKPLMLKELRKLWNKEVPNLPWEKGDYSASNTLLVDDSPYKALRNPPHTAIFPYSYSYLNQNDNSLGPGGDLRVYLQNLAAADDVQCFVRNNPFGQPFITKSDPHWKFYAQIAHKGSTPLTCCA